jgi:hypothetical protein
VDHHEQDRHGADAESVDALADHDRNFHTEIRHFFLQDLDPEEIEQLHIAMREYNTGVLLRFAPRIAQAISDGRLRDPRPRQDTAAPTTASDQLAYRYGTPPPRRSPDSRGETTTTTMVLQQQSASSAWWIMKPVTRSA